MRSRCGEAGGLYPRGLCLDGERSRLGYVLHPTYGWWREQARVSEQVRDAFKIKKNGEESTFWLSKMPSHPLCQVLGHLKMQSGTSLTIQWLRLPTSAAGSAGSIPRQGTKIRHAGWCSQKLKRKMTQAKRMSSGLFSRLYVIYSSSRISFFSNLLDVLHLSFLGICLDLHCPVR